MRHVVMVEPEIHWNTGNAGRSCLAAGAQLHLVGPLGFSLDEKQVRRAGLDYWERVKPRVWPSFGDFEVELASLGEPWFFTPDGVWLPWEVELGASPVLIFGKESTGFDPAIRAKYRARTLRLPMEDPEIRSINVSTCVGVALYEAVRQAATGATMRAPP